MSKKNTYKPSLRLRMKNFWYSVRKISGYLIFLPLWKALYNKNLIKKYPFLEFKNNRCEYFDMNETKPEERGFFERYRSTWNDILEPGWRKAFGKQLWKDLLDAMIKDGVDPHSISILQCKEKYGTLRIYLSFETNSLEDVLSHYEDMSMLHCVHCGKITKYISGGWILYLCEKCAKRRGGYRRLTTRDIPYREIWKGADEKPERIETDVPFKDYWPEPTEEDLKNEF